MNGKRSKFLRVMAKMLFNAQQKTKQKNIKRINYRS